MGDGTGVDNGVHDIDGGGVDAVAADSHIGDGDGDDDGDVGNDGAAVYVDDINGVNDAFDIVDDDLHDADEAGDFTRDADDVGDNDGDDADYCDGCHDFVGDVDLDAGEHDGGLSLIHI